MESLLNRPLFKNLLTALLVVLVIFVAGQAISALKSIKYIGSNISATNTITVWGTADVITAPDIATFSFTVQKEGATVPEAQKAATDAMNAVLAYVKKAGVSDNDVKTNSYNIYPRYDYQPVNATMPNYVGGKQVLAAYVVSQTVEIKVRKLDQAGALLSGIGQYGATDVSGLTFSVDKQTEVERQARDKAIADARQQAEILANSLGVTLGRIVSFSESGGGYSRPIYYAKTMGMGGADSVASAPQIPSGENKVTSNVTITYEIK